MLLELSLYSLKTLFWVSTVDYRRVIEELSEMSYSKTLLKLFHNSWIYRSKTLLSYSENSAVMLPNLPDSQKTLPELTLDSSMIPMLFISPAQQHIQFLRQVRLVAYLGRQSCLTPTRTCQRNECDSRARTSPMSATAL